MNKIYNFIFTILLILSTTNLKAEIVNKIEINGNKEFLMKQSKYTDQYLWVKIYLNQI